jgi:predicted adenylyl cyclase CyaB
MPANIEIKAKVNDPQRVQRLVASIGLEQWLNRQTDTFFTTARGRLKLRQIAPDDGELIYYERSDAPGPTESRYCICKTADPAGLCTVMSAALGVAGVVRKLRHLYLVGQTRIHLDDVEGLGHFIELEVVLRQRQSRREGIEVAQALMARLGISEHDLIDVAYVDLLHEQDANQSAQGKHP